jgi:hypothetical protein
MQEEWLSIWEETRGLVDATGTFVDAGVIPDCMRGQMMPLIGIVWRAFVAFMSASGLSIAQEKSVIQYGNYMLLAGYILAQRERELAEGLAPWVKE